MGGILASVFSLSGWRRLSVNSALRKRLNNRGVRAAFLSGTGLPTSRAHVPGCLSGSRRLTCVRESLRVCGLSLVRCGRCSRSGHGCQQSFYSSLFFLPPSLSFPSPLPPPPPPPPPRDSLSGERPSASGWKQDAGRARPPRGFARYESPALRGRACGAEFAVDSRGGGTRAKARFCISIRVRPLASVLFAGSHAAAFQVEGPRAPGQRLRAPFFGITPGSRLRLATESHDWAADPHKPRAVGPGAAGRRRCAREAYAAAIDGRSCSSPREGGAPDPWRRRWAAPGPRALAAADEIGMRPERQRVLTAAPRGAWPGAMEIDILIEDASWDEGTLEALAARACAATFEDLRLDPQHLASFDLCLRRCADRRAEQRVSRQGHADQRAVLASRVMRHLPAPPAEMPRSLPIPDPTGPPEELGDYRLALGRADPEATEAGSLWSIIRPSSRPRFACTCLGFDPHDRGGMPRYMEGLETPHTLTRLGGGPP